MLPSCDPTRHLRLIFSLLVVDPSCADYPRLSFCPKNDRMYPTYAAAPPPCSQSTCCRTCLCRPRYRAWCHLYTLSVSMLHAQSFNIPYQCSIARDPVLVEVSSWASRGYGGRTCIWWPKSWEVLAKSKACDRARVLTNLQANAAQVAQGTQDSRHGCGWYCARSIAAESRCRPGVAVEAASRGKRGSCSLRGAWRTPLMKRQQDERNQEIYSHSHPSDDCETRLALLEAGIFFIRQCPTPNSKIWARATTILEHVGRRTSNISIVKRSSHSEHYE
jgi:hypothetical protein